jgi:predicted nuclease with RNAse H fold
MSMITLLGIDCATDPKKTGLALGELDGEVVRISRCGVCSKAQPAAETACEWLAGSHEVLIALDAPLGWPRPLAAELRRHRAGTVLGSEANELFRRLTDREIHRRLGKQPLDVGADRIARTAVAALRLLDAIRSKTGKRIPLAWAACEDEPWRAIEVYPAATRIAHGARDAGGSLAGLEGLLDCSAVKSAVATWADAADAAVCVLAAADFLRGRAVPPEDHETAQIEGWIWAAEGQTSR